MDKTSTLNVWIVLTVEFHLEEDTIPSKTNSSVRRTIRWCYEEFIRVVHLRCFLFQKNEKNCHDCGELIKGPYYTVNSEKVICEKDYKVNRSVIFYILKFVNKGGEGVGVEAIGCNQIFF